MYLYYTNPNPGAAPWATGEHNQLSRFTVNDTNPQQPVFTNEAAMLDWNNLSCHQPQRRRHPFRPRRHALRRRRRQPADVHAGREHYRVSQTLGNLLGKQLRIDVSKFNSGVATRDDTAVGHLIPTDNPFVGTATGINQLIYVLGLRNPFTFAVQPGTGKIFINDVGEKTWEEIDQSIAGANYGWSGGNTDGFGQTPPGPGTYHDPLLAYNHSGGPAGGGIAIVGGAFYSPATVQFPSSYAGKYFYGDLTGWIRVFDPAHPGSAANPDTSTLRHQLTRRIPRPPGRCGRLPLLPLWQRPGQQGLLLSPAGDAGFEQVQVGAGHYQYRPTGSAWAFTGNSGLAANNSGSPRAIRRPHRVHKWPSSRKPARSARRSPAGRPAPT